MTSRELLNILRVAERLKDATRHCDTSGGRRESVADHSWRLALMAFFLRDAFPEADMDKVIRMCLIHDLGEAFTGDIPSFLKTDADEQREEGLLGAWVRSLPAPYAEEVEAHSDEMGVREPVEARIAEVHGGSQAVVQHNESDLASWSENEYALNLTYAADRCEEFPPLKALRQAIRADTEQKLRDGGVEC